MKNTLEIRIIVVVKNITVWLLVVKTPLENPVKTTYLTIVFV